MKKYYILIFLIIGFKGQLFSQPVKKIDRSLPVPQKTLTYNMFGIAEPHAALGIGFENIITQRSGYFAEISYIFKAPFYKAPDDITSGYRLIAQYRYYLEKNGNWNYFIGPEFRIKQYGFKGNILAKNSLSGSIKDIDYKANAFSIGGAVLAGASFNISKSRKWQCEMTAGIGAKQKFVKFKNIPQGYEVLMETRKEGLGPPKIYEAVGMPYFPITIRVKYLWH